MRSTAIEACEYGTRYGRPMSPRVQLLSIPLALALAGSAQAAPAPDALFGGGTIGTGTQGGEDADTHYVGARVAKDGAATLTFYADVTLDCGKKGTTLASIAAEDVAIAADGTFAGKQSYKSSGPLGSEGGPVTFTGRLVSDTRIDGTLKATSTIRLKGKKPYTCRTPEVAYTIFDNARDANAAAQAPNGTYAGTTAQDFSTLLRLNSTGEGFAKAAVQGNLACKNAKGGVFSFEIMPGVLIGFPTPGTFSGDETFTTTSGYVKPAFSRVRWTLNGSFAGGKLSGTWKVTQRVYKLKNHKRKIDTCTASIPFVAAQA
jgi:hypothetical protein